jgi:hypothetical protein
LSRASLATVERDTDRWKAEAEPILGPTDIYVYPFGAAPRLGSAIVAYLRDAGFLIQCDINPQPRLGRSDGMVIMSRRHVDGIALRQQRRLLSPLFDTDTVQDRAARQ